LDVHLQGGGAVYEAIDGGEHRGLIRKDLARFAEGRLGAISMDLRSSRAVSIRTARLCRLILGDVEEVIEDQQVVAVELGDGGFERQLIPRDPQPLHKIAGSTSDCSESLASVRSPSIAASATFAFKAGVWIRRGCLGIVSPDLQRTACSPSGRNSTDLRVQISKAGFLCIEAVRADDRTIPAKVPAFDQAAFAMWVHRRRQGPEVRLCFVPRHSATSICHSIAGATVEP